MQVQVHESLEPSRVFSRQEVLPTATGRWPLTCSHHVGTRRIERFETAGHFHVGNMGVMMEREESIYGEKMGIWKMKYDNIHSWDYPCTVVSSSEIISHTHTRMTRTPIFAWHPASSTPSNPSFILFW